MHIPIARSGVALVVLALTVALAPAAGAKKPERYGIEGRFVSYDPEAQTFRILVTSREAGGFGGSTVGDEAPDSLPVKEEVPFAVKPEGSVLSRTVIKSVRGTGLDNSGTQEGFAAAVQAIPTDRSLAISIEPNPAAGKAEGAPAYRIKTLVIQMTEAELRERLEEAMQDD